MDRPTMPNLGLSLGLLLLMSTTCAIAADPSSPLPALDAMMTQFLRDHQVPGAAVAVAKDGKVIYVKGFGLADVEGKQPVLANSLFRIASISKPITAVAVMQLAEGGLNLDEVVWKRLHPALADDEKRDRRLDRVTIRQLLHHTAGYDRGKSSDPMFRDRLVADTFQAASPPTREQIIRDMIGQPLDFEPGSRYAYSNFGYCLLGRVIEDASGRPYENYVIDQVLKPAGITHMRLGRSRLAGRAENEVRYYPRKPQDVESVFDLEPGQRDPKKVPQQYGGWCLENMDSHGGWLASAEELIKFAAAFDGPDCKLLKRESIRTMFAEPDLPEGAGASKERLADGKAAVYYGCGWSVRRVRRDAASGEDKINTWHTGGLAGTSTLLVRRHDGYSWVVLFNSDFTADGTWLAGKIDPLMHGVVK